ncbi:MAG: hypothetical protein LV477_11250 [Candidatus Nitrosotalea sp.]|nr:hypothetical protein [Candidatus Nitrosotalea sp.]
MQVVEVSLEEMWETIEAFGIKRELLDPQNRLPYKTIHDLYLTIKIRKKITSFEE